MTGLTTRYFFPVTFVAYVPSWKTAVQVASGYFDDELARRKLDAKSTPKGGIHLVYDNKEFELDVSVLAALDKRAENYGHRLNYSLINQLSSRNPTVRMLAIRLLCDTRADGLVNLIRPLLEDPSPLVRSEVMLGSQDVDQTFSYRPLLGSVL